MTQPFVPSPARVSNTTPLNLGGPGGPPETFTTSPCALQPPRSLEIANESLGGGELLESNGNSEGGENTLANEILSLMNSGVSGEEEGPEPSPRLENTLPLTILGHFGPGDETPRDADGAPGSEKTILCAPSVPPHGGGGPEVGHWGEPATTQLWVGTPPQGSRGPACQNGSRRQALAGLSPRKSCNAATMSEW